MRHGRGRRAQLFAPHAAEYAASGVGLYVVERGVALAWRVHMGPV